MAATPEARVKAKIKKILTAHDVYYAMPIGSAFGNSGVPDFLCCVQGRFLAIEAKANGNKPTALQLKHIKTIQEARGCALVVDETNLGALELLIQTLKESR
jgi:hypothetical protein